MFWYGVLFGFMIGCGVANMIWFYHAIAYHHKLEKKYGMTLEA